MKIIKLFGVMAIGLALVVMAGCDAGEIRTDVAATGADIEQTGEDDVIQGDPENEVFSSSSDPGLCPGDYLLPAGEQAYFQPPQ